MPLREDLLEPIAGDNPSGENLYYDKVFDQIKEAAREELDTGPAGAWERTPKKADHVAVIKLAGETLATRSKDLRLAAWLIESHVKREGTALLLPGLDLLWKLQEKFWETLHPEKEEDGNVDLRITAIEGIFNRLAVWLRNAGITKSGMSSLQYHESRRVGFETDADTDEKQSARQDAIDQGKMTGEDFDASFNATPKAFYAGLEKTLTDAATLLDDLGRFHEEKYGDDYPSMNKLLTAVEEVRQLVSSLLNEKRKTDPDPEDIVAAESEETYEEATYEEAPAYAEPVAASSPVKKAPRPAGGFAGAPTSAEQAYAAVAACAEYLRSEDAQSPVPYLVCAGLRFGETRKVGAWPPSDFAVAPTTETRQAMRRYINEYNWDELMKLCLHTLAEPCARAWLDLHRYIWRAAKEMGAEPVATAVATTVRGLLLDIPEVRGWILDDDTPVANAETQQWIDTELLPPVAEAAVPAVEEEQAISFVPVPSSSNGSHAEDSAPDLYETATELVRRGSVGDAIRMLVRDSELQPSGRKRFQRRVQVAQLCMMAKQDPVAYPVLMQLSNEIEQRGLETWESGEMLAHPLSLLLQCLDHRKASSEDREALFERLCRLDPQAALSIRR